LVAERHSEGWEVQALGAPHISQRTEADLIRSFIDRIGELRPQLITFNGHNFDLPVLRYRAMDRLGQSLVINMSSIPSACRITNIVRKDAMILPQDANLSWMEFSERTPIIFTASISPQAEMCGAISGPRDLTEGSFMSF
jgi:Predicted 3'-5' exonuclease related to the exonuclease domain of PolB